MSLLWKGANGLMLKNPAKQGAAYRCNCCPCYDGGWYIATVCPCLNCGPSGPAFIGDSILEGNGFVEVEYGPEQNLATFKGLVISPIYPTGQQETRAPECMTVPTGGILYAVRHKTTPAPFDGTVSATLIFSGAFSGVSPISFGPVACSASQEIDIGDSLAGTSSEVKGFLVDETLEDEGSYVVSLRVTFAATASGVADVSYACRAALTAIDPGEAFHEEPWVGSVGVIPEYTGFDEDECIIEGKEPIIGLPVGMFFKPLKGPFASKADAEAVLAEFGDFIRAYAATCGVCAQGPCDVGDGFGVDMVEGNTPGDWHEITEYGSEGDRAPAPYSCAYAWVRWHDWSINIEPDQPFEIKVLHYNKDGEIIEEVGPGDIPPSGIFPPCSGGYRVFVRFNDQDIDPNDYKDILFEGMEILGNTSYITPSDECVVEDDESAYYEFLWDYEHEGDPENPATFVVGQTGVPSSTAAWLDYQCWRDHGGYYVGGKCVEPAP